MRGYSLRECCYDCSLAKSERIGDITIGDCKNYKDYYRSKPYIADRALSTVLINTKKGLNLWECTKDYFVFFETSLLEEKLNNPRLSMASVRPVERSYFYNHLYRLNRKKFESKYSDCILNKSSVKLIVNRLISQKKRWRLRRKFHI